MNTEAMLNLTGCSVIDYCCRRQLAHDSLRHSRHVYREIEMKYACNILLLHLPMRYHYVHNVLATPVHMAKNNGTSPAWAWTNFRSRLSLILNWIRYSKYLKDDNMTFKMWKWTTWIITVMWHLYLYILYYIFIPHTLRQTKTRPPRAG